MRSRSGPRARRRSSSAWSGWARRSRRRSPISCPDGDGRIASIRDGGSGGGHMWEQVKQALNQSFDRVIAGLANLLPGLAALVVALVFSPPAAWVLGWLLRRFLRGINFDKRCAAWGLSGLAAWSPRKSPTHLVTRSVSWLVVLVGFLIGIAAFDAAITSELALSIFRYLPNVVAASGLFLVGNVLARFLARGVLIGAVNHNLQYARLLRLGVKWLGV